MDRRSFLAVGTTAAIAPAAVCGRALGAIEQRISSPSLGVIAEPGDTGSRRRLSPPRAFDIAGARCAAVRFEAVRVPRQRESVSLELMRETNAGLIGTTLWAMNGSSAPSIGAPIAFATPRGRVMRVRVHAGQSVHELEIRAPGADGRGSSLLCVPLRRGVGAPVWRLWSAEFGAGSRITRVHRPFGLDTDTDGRLLIAVTPCELTL